MTMMHYGVDAEKLPKPELDEKIHRNKVTDIDTPEYRQIAFHVIFKNVRYVIMGIFFKKRRLMQLQH